MKGVEYYQTLITIYWAKLRGTIVVLSYEKIMRELTLFTVNGKNRHDDTSDDCVMREDSITGGIKR